MVFLVIHPITCVFSQQHGTSASSSASFSYTILSAALYCFKTCLVTGLLEASLIVVKGNKLIGLKLVGLLFQSTEATVLL